MQSVINPPLAEHHKKVITNTSGGADIIRTASLVTIAAILQISESLIPHPVPGIRLGLANMITLVTLVYLGFKPALEVAILRTVLSSLVLGTFLTPTFLLSFAGALISTLLMSGFFWFSSRIGRYGFGLIGISVLGAISHNLVQLILAYYLLIQHPSIFYFLPWLMVSAVIMGWLTGLVAVEIIRRLFSPASEDSAGVSNIYPNVSSTGDDTFRINLQPGNSFIHRTPPEWKIAGAVILLGLVLFVKTFFGQGLIMTGLIGLMILTKLPLKNYFLGFSRLRKLSSFIMISFAFPVLFSSNSGGNTLLNLGPLKITESGFASGSLFALRIIGMAWVGFLLNVYTTPAQLAEGIRRILRPFRFIGISGQRIGSVISLSWESLPVLWEKTRTAIRTKSVVAQQENKKVKLIPFLAGLIVSLYRQTE